MASKFFKDNFKSMNLSEEEKQKKFDEYRKSIIGIAAGDKEIEFLLKQFKEENE